MKKIILLGLLSFSCVLQAEPIISSNTQYYTVDGVSVDDIRADMNSKRPIAYDAHTDWYVKWRFYWQNNGKYCVFTQITTSVDVKFILPQLAANTQADQDALARWQPYYQALIAHENGHRDFGVNAAIAIEKALWNIGSRDNCLTLEKEANDLAYRILNQYIADEKQYDIDTNHGVNDGAYFR